MSDPLAPVIAALTRESGASSDFDLNPEMTLPPARRLRPAGVLVAFTLRAGVPHVILTKRASHLKHHPGQIAFPGGKQDEGDADVIATALREAEEEIGLPPDRVEILGHLPNHETVTAFNMTPVLGRITDHFEIRPEPGEVDEVFFVPFHHLSDPARYSVQARRWQGRWRYYQTIPYGPYYIWGATARVLYGLAQRMAAS
ncbi:8-oxo-dGTP pyrophosphatase MutT, NUDIX family [Salinihabitans flavidus]|uniref:8-oxo-dGTP pyrophosphatase MutT, NUDIX family n=1 Tax=Salinihabitans flavidus TaxID=569882 RepID=A0A1H8LX37_9RHOB|nr:CoA pyrophosphatase [Salinihabitans flavidus]SEO09677.1 8-oxo-dGTP pyrophosphatase MutT, NUDIX family [Salinihabitans flavidus]